MVKTMARFTRVQLEVEALVLARGNLAAAEELINNTPRFTEEQRAALWLYAWSCLPRDRQRKEALAHLRAVTPS